ncbi:MAG: hypothetical protein LBU88_01245 [Treponema sp.]|jgi:uncharacterized membrane protein|nr:hypothetical protein [Treponema sp.]
MEKKKIIKVHPAYIAVWASVVAAGHLIPTLPILGTGANFSLANILSPLSGIFFGPITGALCSAIGGFIGSFVSPIPPLLGPFNFLIGTVTAFTTGSIAWSKWPPVKVSVEGNFIFNGGLIVYFIGTILWFTQSAGRNFIWLPIVFYGLGFIAMITGFVLTGRFFASSKKVLKLFAIWLSAFGGLIGGATMGNFFYLVIFNPPAIDLMRLIIVSPLERALFAAAAAAIGLPLLEGLRKIGIPAGPEAEFNRQREEESD